MQASAGQTACWRKMAPALEGTWHFFPLMGSYIPFPRTKTEREQTPDPRLSIEERYHSRDKYLKLVQQSANALVTDGFLLVEDVPAIVKHAGEHWAYSAEHSTTTTSTSAR